MDRTKWFTMVGFEANSNDYSEEDCNDNGTDISENEKFDAESEYDREQENASSPIESGGTCRQDEGTIPDVTTDSIYNIQNQTFEEFMNEKGFEQFEYPTADDGVVDAWGISPHKKLSPGKLKSLELEYKRRTGNSAQAEQQSSGGNDDIKSLFALFSGINPAWKMFFKIPAQRTAAEELLSRENLDGLKKIIEVAKASNAEPADVFSPKIYSPYDLITKMNKLKAYAKRNQ